MSLTIDWSTKIITVPQSDLTLIVGTRYKITVDFWFSLLRELNATQQGIVETVNSSIYKNTSPTTTTPRIVDVINGYTVQFENLSYSVEFVDGNTNIREIEIKNLVSVGTNNTSALINPVVLEAGVYSGQIVIDMVNGYAGDDKTPDGELIGTFRAPSNNVVDTLYIATIQGVRNLYILGNLNINEDLSLGYNLIGSSPFNIITCNPIANLSTVSMTNLTVVGELDGINVLRACNIQQVTNVSGLLDRCALADPIFINGRILIADCYSNVQGSGTVQIHGFPTAVIEVRNFHGSITLSNIIDEAHSVDGYGGRLIIDSSNTGGVIYIRGDWFEILDNSGSGCTVFDERNLSNFQATTDNTQVLAAIATLNDFDPGTEQVVASNMRGTDGANTVIPNNTTLNAILNIVSSVLPTQINGIPSAPLATQIADAILIRNLAGGSNGGRTIQDALRPNRNRVAIDDIAKTVTVYKEDDVTVAWIGNLVLAERDAINSVDPV